jgi:alginate O-acetyltransferase complex protein AlgI
LIVIAILSLLIFITGKVLQKRNSKTLLFSTISVVLILFSIRNYPYLQDNISNGVLSFLNAPILSVQKLGLSYILFRFIHYLVESFNHKIHKPNFITFLNYIFFFPTIIAGPIDSYNNYSYWINNKRIKYQYSLFFAGITRIFIGAFKTMAIVPLIINYAQDYTSLTSDFSPFIAILISLLAYSIYIYLDFSGYSDIAIGTAYLLGIKTPENFNNPYFSENLSDFWKRWHITFSTFLKLYVFKPSILLYNKIFNPKYRLGITILCYLTTFAICGLWHGDKINFLYWGLWHGIGLSLNKVWTVNVKPKLSFSNTYGYKYASVLTTFMFVTIGWVFFNYSEEQLIEIYNLLV